LILTVICRPDIDRTLATKVAQWLWKTGIREAEFYVWGDDADG
jgi:hypothetical protein